MDGILINLGLMAVIAVVLYMIAMSYQKSEDEAKEDADLFKYIKGKDKKFDKNMSRSNIKRILSNPETRRYAEEQRQKAIQKTEAYEDKRRKELILKRTYSYQYEDVVYEIFAPLAVKEKNAQLAAERGGWHVSKSLDKAFVQNEIARIMKISDEDASNLLFEFKENKMIKILNIPPKLNNACFMGDLLLYQWDIISKQDKNISKWIGTHPDRENEDSFNKRLNAFKNIE